MAQFLPMRKPMKPWPVREARARFSKLLTACLRDGPQLITRGGVDTAVLVPVEQWRQVNERTKPTLKELLLADTPRFDLAIPPRRSRRRSAVR
jgi:prevent-host-death family protein